MGSVLLIYQELLSVCVCVFVCKEGVYCLLLALHELLCMREVVRD